MRKKISGIYQIRNKINGKLYVGSSVHIISRWSRHRMDLLRQKHPNKHLQAAWNKYGQDNFEFSVLLTCNIDQLFIKEQQTIDELKPQYNKTLCAECPTRGTKHSLETRLKMSQAAKGRPSPMKGKHHSEETKAILAEKSIGNTSRLGRGGQTLSLEARTRISEGLKKAYSEGRRTA